MKHKTLSPYVRYKKRPRQYSELYRRWRRAVLEGRRGEAEVLGRQHSLAFGPRARTHRAAA